MVWPAWPPRWGSRYRPSRNGMRCRLCAFSPSSGPLVSPAMICGLTCIRLRPAHDGPPSRKSLPRNPPQRPRDRESSHGLRPDCDTSLSYVNRSSITNCNQADCTLRFRGRTLRKTTDLWGFYMHEPLTLPACLTPEKLRELLDYNPVTGKFFWGSGPRFGREVATPHIRGYLRVHVAGRAYLAHRLAWFYVHGEWPAHVIDHINCVKTDNRIANLRSVTSAENNRAAREFYSQRGVTA